MPGLKQPRKLNCRWCGASFETSSSQRRYCSDRCLRKHVYRTQSARKLARETPRPCPCCGTSFAGPANKLYCSGFCSDKQQRKSKVYDNKERMKNHIKKTEVNLLTSPPCSLCSKTTARKGYYKSRELPIELPEDIHLCGNHHGGYARFVRRNGYEGQHPEIVFTTYLIHQTYSTRGAASTDKDMAVLKGILSGKACSLDYQCR